MRCGSRYPRQVPGLPVGQVFPECARGRRAGGAPDALNDLAPSPGVRRPRVAGEATSALHPPRRLPGVRGVASAPLRLPMRP